MDEKWVELIYREKYYGDVFKISNLGRLKNINTNNIVKTKRERRLITGIIYYKNKAVRINIGEAQEDSGLTRTIKDFPPKEKRPNNDSRIDLLENKVSLLEEILRSNNLKL